VLTIYQRNSCIGPVRVLPRNFRISRAAPKPLHPVRLRSSSHQQGMITRSKPQNEPRREEKQGWQHFKLVIWQNSRNCVWGTCFNRKRCHRILHHIFLPSKVFLSFQSTDCQTDSDLSFHIRCSMLCSLVASNRSTIPAITLWFLPQQDRERQQYWSWPYVRYSGNFSKAHTRWYIRHRQRHYVRREKEVESPNAASDIATADNCRLGEKVLQLRSCMHRIDGRYGSSPAFKRTKWRSHRDYSRKMG